MNDNLEIRLVRTKKELHDALHIRYNVFVEEGHLPKKQSLEMEYDEFDLLEETKIFNAYLNNIPIGTVRLVLDSKYGLPLEREIKEFSEIKKSEGVFAEGSRIAIQKKHRGKKVAWGLLKAGIVYAINEGVTDIFSAGNVGDVGFDVANNIFVKMGYVPLHDPVALGQFKSRIVPLRLKVSEIKEPFRSFMEEKSDYIEHPYNQIKFRQL